MFYYILPQFPMRPTYSEPAKITKTNIYNYRTRIGAFALKVKYGVYHRSVYTQYVL